MKILTLTLFSWLCTATSASALVLPYEQQIEAAKTAAPAHITDNASYMVWTGSTFKKIIEGTNNFTCFLLTDPKGRFEPSCLNEEAMRSVFPVYAYQTRMLYAGQAFLSIIDDIARKARDGEFPAAGHGGLVYMMSQENKWYSHREGRSYDVPPHLMFYYPTLSLESFGFTEDFGQPDLTQEYPHLSTMMLMMDKQ